MKLNLDKIRTDGGTQPRSELLTDVIEDYAEQMRQGAEFPPVVVFFDGKEYWLADGFHRFEATCRARPSEPIEAEVLQGTQTEAQWYSFGVNKTHGLRRTREDRVRAIKAALRHPEGARRSDNDIAKHVGVSPSTVGKYRTELELTFQIGKSSSQTGETGEDLEQRPTCQIGKSSTQPAEAGKEQSSPQTDRTRQEREDSKSQPTASRPRIGRDGRTINTAKIGKGAKKGNRNGKGRVTVHFPQEAREAVEQGRSFRVKTMVDLELPTNHAPNCAYDLLSVFPFEYLQKVFREVERIHQERQQKETAE